MLIAMAGALHVPLFAGSQMLGRDADVTFHSLLRQSLALSPEYIALAARDEEAKAHVEAAKSWLAGRPSVEASYTDDRVYSSQGAMELEVGVRIPLWRPGERLEAGHLGRATGEQAAAWRAYLELTVAGRLRVALFTLEAAEHLLQVERKASSDAQSLVTTVETLFDAGDASALDVAQARTAVLAQRRQELDADAEFANATAVYTRLTGLSVRPVTAHREAADGKRVIDTSHPFLRLLAADAAVAEAQIARARLEAKGNPSLGLGARRERGGKSESYDDSLTVGLSVPFGGRSHINAAVSGARRLKAEADVALRAMERDLRQQLEEALREQLTLSQTLRLTEEQAAVDRKQWEMARAAFEVGEVTLFQVLTSLRQSRASARDHELLTLKTHSLNAQLNQIVGILP